MLVNYNLQEQQTSAASEILQLEDGMLVNVKQENINTGTLHRCGHSFISPMYFKLFLQYHCIKCAEIQVQEEHIKLKCEINF